MFSHFQGSSERASSTHISSCHLCHLTDKEHPNEQRWDGNIASDVGAAGRHHDLLREVACYEWAMESPLCRVEQPCNGSYCGDNRVPLLPQNMCATRSPESYPTVESLANSWHLK